MAKLKPLPFLLILRYTEYEVIQSDGKKDEKHPKSSKFMVSPSKYEVFKFGRESLKNEERGMRLMLQYYPEYFTEEQLRANMQHYNLENMFALVKKYFQKEYNYSGGNIELNNRYQRSVNSYIYDDTENPAIVHIDELFEPTVMAFFWQYSNGRRILRTWRYTGTVSDICNGNACWKN